MLRKSELDAIIPSLRQRLLVPLLLQPERSWYLTELARHLDVRPSTIQRELSQLADVGLLTTHQRGRLILYQANLESPILVDLQNLLTKTVGLVNLLRNTLEPFVNEIERAFIYGPVAAGDAHPGSDVDVMIVGDARPKALANALRPIHQKLARPINVRYYTSSEFAQKHANGDHFLISVIRKPRIDLIGNSNDLDPS